MKRKLQYTDSRHPLLNKQGNSSPSWLLWAFLLSFSVGGLPASYAEILPIEQPAVEELAANEYSADASNSEPVNEGFSANFKNTDIQEFINTVSKNLNKTVIIDPSVRGNITVRSYDQLDLEQYYQFFLSVLEVYGFSVITMDNGFLKVIPSQSAKGAAIPLVSGNSPASGDEVIIRVVPVHNVSAKDLVPLLRQLNDTAGVGSVVHYDPSNVLLITGRAAVVNRLMEIVKDVDKTGDQVVQTIPLAHASAADVAKMISTLNKEESGGRTQNNSVYAKLIADERTNSVLISGEEKARQRAINLIRQLDREQSSQGNTRVIPLQYAKATNLVEVLTGVSAGMQSSKNDGKKSAPAVALLKNVTIKADEHNNALIITAAPDMMRDLEKVITQLDIRRPQVLVEAIIVEVADSDALNLGIQWFNKYGGGTKLGSGEADITTLFKDGKNISDVAQKGLTAGFYSGNWAALLTALSSNSKNNILATPSVVTLDNVQAEFSIGQEIPIKTGEQLNNDGKVFNTVGTKSVGTKLKVKPQINKGNSVMMEIEQEVSSVSEKPVEGTKELGASFNVRKVNNAVLVNDGETVVIGGLLDKTDNKIEEKVPLLGDIPLLGNLFRYTSNSSKKQNLILFIRPTIIRTEETYQNTSAIQYNRFQDQYDNNEPIKQKIPDELKALRDTSASRDVFIQVQNDIEQFFATGRP